MTDAYPVAVEKSADRATPMSGWTRIGKTMQAEGLEITKTSGGNYPRHASHGEVMSSGVHTWELVFTAAANSNGNRTMYVGVGREGLDVEKGNHHKADAWYLRTDDATLYGGGADKLEQKSVEKAFQVGDRIGVRMDCDDGSLRFYKNGEAIPAGFPAGTITGPVVGAVEFLCVGQALTLVPEASLA